MFKISSPKKSSTPKDRILPGDYIATVTSVAWSKGYDEGDAIDINYDVETIKDGVPYIIPFKECFFVKGTSPRTILLHDLLAEIGAVHYDDLIGRKLQLTFVYQLNDQGRRFCNVIVHSFVKEGDADGTCGTESQIV